MPSDAKTIRAYERAQTDIMADPGRGIGYFTFYQIAAAVFRAVPDLERVTIAALGPMNVEVRTPSFMIPLEAVRQIDAGRAIATTITYSARMDCCDA